MILSDQEIQERMESPINLMNRLRDLSTKQTPIPTMPSAAELIPDIDDKLNNTKTKAHSILNAAMDEIRKRLPEVHKVEKLAEIANTMSRVVAQQEANKQGSVTAGQIVIYAPSVRSLNDYDIIDVQEKD